MQSLTYVFRRFYATTLPDKAITALPAAAQAARTASTPLAVRLRRLRKRPSFRSGDSDATASGLTPTEFSRYQRFLAKGELTKEDGSDLTEAEWLDRLNEKRSRIRGLQLTEQDGVKQLRVVGQKIYLPNIIFRMVRNHTPPGKPYNPYEATFRVPQSVTKTDIRSYLSAVYGVKTTYIRTDNYISPLSRTPRGTWTRDKVWKTYKRAVVGLVDPFYYPQAMEDMSRKEREERMMWLEEKFGIDAMRKYRHQEYQRLWNRDGKGRRSRLSHHTNRRKILHAIAARRNVDNARLEERKRTIEAMRSKGIQIATQRLDLVV